VVCVWDPARISSDALSFYIENMKKLWPYHLFDWLEEEALHFLALKNYQVEITLLCVLHQVDQLLDLIKTKN
jgi:hypothetical protein